MGDVPAGRPRKPAKLKALSGETRPSRLQAEPQPRESEPRFPEWLGEDARPIWDRVTAELASMTLLFSADQDAIAAYVSSVALLEAAERGLAEEGYATRDDHGRLHRSPWLMIRRDGLDGVHRFGSLLGLNPTARTRLPVSPPRTELDELADRLLSH